MAQDARGDYVAVTWADRLTTYGDTRVMISQSFDGGATFASPRDLGTFPKAFYNSGYPVPLVRNDGAILVLTFQGTVGCTGLSPGTSISTDRGQTFRPWGAPTAEIGSFIPGKSFTWNRGGTQFNVVSTGPGCANLDDSELAYFRSLDGGATWQSLTLVPPGGIARGSASVAQTDSGNVVAAWLEASTPSRFEVMIRVSEDGGSTFSAPRAGGIPSLGIGGAVGGLLLQVAGDVVTVQFGVDSLRFTATSFDGGRTFGPAEVADFNRYGSLGSPARAIGSGRVSDFGSSNPTGLFCQLSTTNGRTWGAVRFFTAGTASIYLTTVGSQAGGFGAPIRAVWRDSSGKFRLGDVTAACE